MESRKQLVKEPESIAVIRFQDCDPFGHLNNARYVDYFMDARFDHLAEHYDIHLFEQGHQESWVVSKSHISFVSPALLTERVRIRTRLIHVSDRTLVVEGLMLSEDGRRLKAVLWMEFTYISLSSGRPAQHSEEQLSLFRSLLIDAGYEHGFDRRAEALRAEYRRRPERAVEVEAAA
jgi:acyl-CoA thioester hydrolase